MRKIAQVFLWLGFFCLLAPLATKAESIQSFDVNAEVLENGSVLIAETILYDFGDLLKHGIYRGIPLKGIAISDVVVGDGQGNGYIFSTSKDRNNLRIKIGDPDILISGIQQYQITYKVQKALGYFKDHDEFYWNATGNSWEVNIEKASFSLKLPQEVGLENIQQDCFTGALGAKEKTCSFKEMRFQSQRVLYPSEGLTIVVGWPKGIVAGPSFTERFFDFLKKWGVYLIPVVVFFYLFFVWWKKGKDIKLNKTVIVQYDLPSDLRPAEVGCIMRQKVSPQDVSATVVDLAVRGYLKIKETQTKVLFFKKKDWEIIKTKEFKNDSSLEPYEKFLLEKLFFLREKISISELQMGRHFSKHFAEIKEMVSKEMVQDDYFSAEPVKTMKKFAVIGVGLLVFGFIGGVPIIACGALFLIFSVFMPKKTMKGTETLWQIAGFKEYIKTAEKYRVQFQEKENIFEKYLPFAIVFGLTKKWAKAFEGIYNQQPAWFESSSMGYFSAIVFTNTLGDSLKGFSGAVAPQGGGHGSGLGGGGFSGGGGGGGGGGSW